MKKIKLIKRILIIPVAIFLCFVIFSFYKKEKVVSTVRAFGDLVVDFKSVLPGEAIFKVFNFLPGDSEEHDVDLTNNGDVIRQVVVRGFKKYLPGQIDPKLETVLDIEIIENGNTSVYSNKLQNFFADSRSPNGVMLTSVNPGQTKNYNFKVTFPESAGNDFQNKSVVFDLIFDRKVCNHVVINEFHCKNKIHKCDWIELYNPTDHDIWVRGWKLEDNKGKRLEITGNKKIKAGKFLKISKNVKTKNFFNNGFDITSGTLHLKDNNNKEIDFVSWGGKFSGWDLKPQIGKSFVRKVPGLDSDNPSDWQIK